MRQRAYVLTSPPFLCAIAVLVINDHVLKAAWPSPITGKISDFAGVIMIAIALSVVTGRRVAVAATAIGFTALKAVPGANQLAAPILGGVTLADRTDLIALAALVCVYRWLGMSDSATDIRPTLRSSPILALPAAAAALIATTATSCAGPEGVVTLAYEDDTLYAGVGEYNEYDDRFVDEWAVSHDRGRTWQQSTTGPSDNARWSDFESCDDAGVCWRAFPESNLTRCNTAGICVRAYEAEDAPAPRTNGCPETYAQFNSVITIPGQSEPGAAIVAMGAGGVAIQGQDGSFRRVAVLGHGGDGFAETGGQEQPPILVALAAPLLLAAIGTPATASTARRNRRSIREPIALCLVAAFGIGLFGVLLHALGVRTAWVVAAVLSIAAFILAMVRANAKPRELAWSQAQPSSAQPVPWPPQSPTTTTNSAAIAALVLGIVGVFMFLTAPVAIVFGHIARRQIAATGQPGRSLANTGLTFGYLISLAVVTFMIVMQG